MFLARWVCPLSEPLSRRTLPAPERTCGSHRSFAVREETAPGLYCDRGGRFCGADRPQVSRGCRRTSKARAFAAIVFRANVYGEPTGLHNWAPALMGHLAFLSPICGLGAGSCRLADFTSLGGERRGAYSGLCARAAGMRVRLPTAVAQERSGPGRRRRQRRNRDLSRLRVEPRATRAQLVGLGEPFTAAPAGRSEGCSGS